MVIKSFKDTFLSNMWNGGKEEIVYHTMKAYSNEDAALVCNAKNGYEAKKLGKQIKVRLDWDEVKLDIMETILRLKFSDPLLAKKLKETAPNILIEGNCWHDNFWGSCTCAKCGNKGKNELGKLLMRIREQIGD